MPRLRASGSSSFGDGSMPVRWSSFEPGVRSLRRGWNGWWGKRAGWAAYTEIVSALIVKAPKQEHLKSRRCECNADLVAQEESLDKRTTVKFWQIHTPKDEIEFDEALRICFAKPLLSRYVELETVPFFLEGEANQGGPDFIGDVIRLQSAALPSVISKGASPEKLNLGTGKSLGHHSGFIYDKETRLFGIEVRPTAAGLSKTLGVVSAISKRSGYAPTPVLTKSKFNELASARNGKFTFKIADPASLETTDPQLEDIRANLNQLKGMIDGSYLQVTVGVGRRKTGLDMQGILKWAGWLSSERDQKRGKVRSIRVVQPDEATPILDFIKGQVKKVGTLDLDGDPAKDWPLRMDFLREALIEAKAHVRKSGTKH